MYMPVFTARPLGEAEDYLALTSQGLRGEAACLEGDGSARRPWKVRITITNEAAQPWQGVIRMTMPVAEDARFFLPGFMYGTNRGEAPLKVESPCPRLREKTEFPASPWWQVRSDRLSHPAAFAYAEGRMRGMMAPPYFVMRDGRQQPWQPGVKEEFSQYAGFGCSLTPGGLMYTLGYENAPWMFVQSHTVQPRKPMGENCFVLQAGESVTFDILQYDIPAQDERALHQLLRQVYAACHEAPRKACTVRRTVENIATAIAQDAWIADMNTYACFVFDRGDHHELRPLPSIAWTNGLAAAVPMLQSALRLKNEEMRSQTLACVEHIVAHSINEKSGLPFMAETEDGWTNKGWWYENLRTPGHASYLVGQSVYLILKAYLWEKQFAGVEHTNWLDFAGSVISRTEKTRNSDGEYPYVLSAKTGAGLEYDSMAGAWCLAAAVMWCHITGERSYLPGLLESEKYYHRAFVCPQECYGGPLDIDKSVDSEGILAYIRAVRYLHEITGEEYLLDHLKDGLEYEYTFKFCYNSPVKVPPLSRVGWSSCGGSITSVTNPHIHPMSSSVADEMCYYLRLREDAYIRSRLEDVTGWNCQTHNSFDKEFDYGKTGWMSERFCHSEGLLTERYPDGSPASTWFALMPWAAGCILEGLTGDMWERDA